MLYNKRMHLHVIPDIEIKKSQKLLSECLKDDPTPEVQFGYAKIMLYMGKLNEALKNIERALKVEPKNPEFLLWAAFMSYTRFNLSGSIDN